MPKNAKGLIRSRAMMSPATSMPVDAAPKMPKPTLDHLRIHPVMGGGVRVEHHMSSEYGGSNLGKSKEFKPDQGQAFAKHMEKHTGMSWEPKEPTTEANQGAENEVDDLDSDKE